MTQPCLLIVDHLYTDLEGATLQAEDSKKVETNPAIVTEIYISALGLIDYFHRFHEIVSAMTLIRKDQAELKGLARALAPVKECRNYLQHMRGDLNKNQTINYPILGGITWIHDSRNYILFSNQPTQNYSLPSIVYDTVENKYLCKYQLVVGGHQIPIDTVYTEIKVFWKWLEELVIIEPSHIKEYIWGRPMIMYSEFKKT